MSNMRSYEAARGLFSFLAFVGWSAVTIGVLAAFAGANARSGGMFGGNIGIIGAVPGIIIAVLGLFQVAIVQAARATVDTAEYTQQMLKIARDQLNVSKQALKQGKRTKAGFAKSKPPKSKESKASFADKAGKSKHKKKKKKAKVPVEAITAATVELDVKETVAPAPESPELEATQPLPIPELPVEPAGEPLQETVAIEENREPEPEIIPEPLHEPEPKFFEYKGRVIEWTGRHYIYSGIEFISMEKAEQYIDAFASPLPDQST